MAKAVIFLADGFEEVEALTTVDILRRANIETTIAGLKADTATGSHRITVSVDTTIDRIVAKDFDIAILPGGPGTDNLDADERLRKLVLEFYESGKWVAAICAAPYILNDLGILKGRRATSFPTRKPSMTDCIYVEDLVVVDGNVITSRAAGTTHLFALTIAEKLAGKETADKVRSAMLYDKI